MLKCSVEILTVQLFHPPLLTTLSVFDHRQIYRKSSQSDFTALEFRGSFCFSLERAVKAEFASGVVNMYYEMSGLVLHDHPSN